MDRARQLGWTTVEVIDDDLGRRAAASFDRASSACWLQSAKPALALCSRSRVSRLARNNRDWHTLIEFCGLVGTIIVDEDGIYDPRHPNDQLLLGMKGTMSELELSLFRQRSQEALKQKARRGALVLGVAAGYVKVGRDRITRRIPAARPGCIADRLRKICRDSRAHVRSTSGFAMKASSCP